MFKIMSPEQLTVTTFLAISLHCYSAMTPIKCHSFLADMGGKTTEGINVVTMVTSLSPCGKGFEMFASLTVTLSTDTTRAFLSFVQLIIYKDTVAQLQTGNVEANVLLSKTKAISVSAPWGRSS